MCADVYFRSPGGRLWVPDASDRPSSWLLTVEGQESLQKSRFPISYAVELPNGRPSNL